jgi:hypothetical protein
MTQEDRLTARIVGVSLFGLYMACMVLAAAAS